MTTLINSNHLLAQTNPYFYEKRAVSGRSGVPEGKELGAVLIVCHVPQGVLTKLTVHLNIWTFLLFYNTTV